jgi:hypothetical protein
MYCIVRRPITCGLYHVVSYRTVQGLPYVLCRSWYRTVLPEEIQYEPRIVCTVRGLPYMYVLYCRPITRGSYIVSCRVVLCVRSYRINIKFLRLVFRSYHNFPRIVSWFLSGRIVWNLWYDLQTTRYDRRGVIGSYSVHDATIWYLLMELAVWHVFIWPINKLVWPLALNQSYLTLQEKRPVGSPEKYGKGSLHLLVSSCDLMKICLLARTTLT